MARSTGIGVFAISTLIVVLVAIISGYYINIQAGRIRELESQLNTWMNNYNQLYSEHQDLIDRYNKLSRDYNSLQSDYNRLSADYKNLLNKHVALSQAYDALSANYTALMQAYKALDTNYTVLQNAYASLKSNYDSLNANYTALQSAYAALKADYDTLQVQYKDLSSKYNSLNASYTALLNNYTMLKAGYDQLYSEYTSLIDWYNAIRDQVNFRSLPPIEKMPMYITPDDPAVVSTMYSVTGGWGRLNDWNEFWSDVYKLYKWVKDNIIYSYDSPEPVLPEIGGTLAWRDEFFRFPNETLRDGTGDCEDMANLLASLILAYNGKVYNVWVMIVYFDDGGHATVVIPVSGGMITIVDPAGHYYTSSFGVITARDVATELQNYFNYWASAGHKNGRVYAIYSYNMYKVFNSNQEFIDYVRSST